MTVSTRNDGVTHCKIVDDNALSVADELPAIDDAMRSYIASIPIGNC